MKYKTDWDLKKLYKSEKEIDKHIEKIGKKYEAFEKKYRGKDFTSTEGKLLSVLKDSEKLSKEADASRPGYYLGLSNSLDSSDQKIEAKLNIASQKLAEFHNRLVFMSLEIGNIDKKKQQKYLKSEKLAPYRYMLKVIFENAKHNLSEKEEQLLNLMSLPSSSLWVRGVQKVQGKLTVKHGKKDIPLTEALSLLSGDMTIENRRKLWNKVKNELKKVADFSESEINALVLGKKIKDGLRGYEYPYSASILSKENTEEEVMALVDSVTDGFKLSRKFYSLKKKLHGMDEFEYVDRMVKIGKIKKKFDFKSSAETLLDIFGDTDTEFADILKRMLAEGQIDAFPKKGKRGGAFCASETDLPTYVLLNHTDDFYSLNTFAHEMGHAIHYEMSKVNPPRYQDMTTSVAEVASTFFENIVFYKLFEGLSKEEKLIALHDKLSDAMAGIIRQIAFFNFEKELHETIRERGSLSHEEIAKLFKKHLENYLGKDVKVSLDDGYSYIYTPHFRSFFYVYSYAYGELISGALYEKYKENQAYINEIKKFLSAGGKKSPYDIFKDIGIDTRDPSFWKTGLKNIEKSISSFEKLVKKI